MGLFFLPPLHVLVAFFLARAKRAVSSRLRNRALVVYRIFLVPSFPIHVDGRP